MAQQCVSQWEEASYRLLLLPTASIVLSHRQKTLRMRTSSVETANQCFTVMTLCCKVFAGILYFITGLLYNRKLMFVWWGMISIVHSRSLDSHQQAPSNGNMRYENDPGSPRFPLHKAALPVTVHRKFMSMLTYRVDTRLWIYDRFYFMLWHKLTLPEP